MGTIEMFLCIFVGQFIAVQSVINEQDATIPLNFPGFLRDSVPFAFRRKFDFTPFDTIFGSWRIQTPDFHMLAELPQIMNVPKVEVFCDELKLTLLVDKRSNGVLLTREEIQLGDGCYSNRELPNQFVFTYSLDECGTTHAMQNGLEVFTNSLHLNLKTPLHTWWQTPSMVHISCFPKRSYENPNFFVSTALLENGKAFNIKAMNPSWTSTAESNIYTRGQVVNFQVSARTRPEQQLFIQSCFISASPEPQTRSRHVIIMNKGCTAPLGSPHAVVRFVASDRADVVNFALNTSYLTSELYIHCSVLISDQGVTFGSKSCNYNVIQSRWEDLSGTVEVCKCCSSKCKGLSSKHLQRDAKAIVSTGPFVIVDKDVETSPESSVSELQQTSSSPVGDSLQSDGAAADDATVSGTSVSQMKFSSPPQGVVAESQDPVDTLPLWLPGQVQDAEYSENVGSESQNSLTVQLQGSDMLSNDLSELQPGNWNFLPLADGWALPQQQEKAAIAEESQRKMWFGWFGAEAPQEVAITLPAETIVNDRNEFNQVRDELVQRQADAAVVLQEGTNDAQPVIRSKLALSKSADGSQTLSYEEEVVKQQAGEGVTRRFKRKPQPGKRGLFSTFLDLLRRTDGAE